MVQELYVFLGQTLKPGYPVPLASLGLPLNLTHIDAAFFWGYNQKIYLFHNDLYWRYDEYDGRVSSSSVQTDGSTQVDRPEPIC